jgi:hypothetical protein
MIKISEKYLSLFPLYFQNTFFKIHEYLPSKNRESNGNTPDFPKLHGKRADKSYCQNKTNSETKANQASF